MHALFVLGAALVVAKASGWFETAPWWAVVSPIGAWLVLHALLAWLGLIALRIEADLKELDRVYRL